MADAVTLSREQLLAALRTRGPIFAPNQNGHWATTQELPELGPVRPKRPLKDLFTPPRREIARWKAGAGPADIVPAPVDETPGSAFGVRPCDARAVQLLDRVFLKEPYVDPHYKARRDNLLLVGVACQPAESCACGVFGFGPDDTRRLGPVPRPGRSPQPTTEEPIVPAVGPSFRSHRATVIRS